MMESAEAGKNKSRNNLAPAKDYGNDSWDNEPISDDLILAVCKAGKWAVIFGGNYYAMPPASCWLVWDKENGSNGYADCELAWTNLPKAVRRIKWRWAGMLQQDMSNKEDRVHPTQKPVAVMQWSIEQAGNANTVLDPFMGSGTTGVACAQMGKAFTGIERERKYFDIACERIARAQAQGQMFAPESITQTQEALI